MDMKEKVAFAKALANFEIGEEGGNVTIVPNAAPVLKASIDENKNVRFFATDAGEFDYKTVGALAKMCGMFTKDGTASAAKE